MTTDERHELITSHRGLAESLAARAMTKYGLPESMREDLKSVAALGLVEAASRFDQAKGAKFSTWAFMRIQGSIVDELRTRGPEMLEEADFKSDLPSPEEQAAMAETAMSLRSAMEALSERERQVLHGHYMKDQNLNEIASELGVVRCAVSHYKTRALEKLRKRLQRDLER